MAEEVGRLDTAERIVKLVRELAVFVLAGYLAWYLIPFVPKWIGKLEQKEISELTFAGVGVKLAKAEEKLLQAGKSDTPQKSAREEAITPEKKLIAEALEAVRSASVQATPVPVTQPTSPTNFNDTSRLAQSGVSFWVYLGVATGDSLPPRNFRVSKLPAAGDVITATTEVYKRSSAPSYRDNGEWLLGDVVGVVRSGQAVVVRKLERIESTQPGSTMVWAEVTVQR